MPRKLTPEQEAMKVERFELGDFELECRAQTTDWFLMYRCIGDAKNPAILKPTCFGGTIRGSDVPVGEEHTITPARYYIIFVGMFGGSESSSPSNTNAPFNGGNFPPISLADQVNAQKKLCDFLGIKKLFAVAGFSMGACQAFQWGVQYPDYMDFIIPVCGSARCSPHNYTFLEGPKNALLADQNFKGGHYTTDALPRLGTKGFARAYSGWGYSSAWYTQGKFLDLGFKDLDDYLVQAWDGSLGTTDANDLLCLTRTWQTANVANIPPYNGDFEAAMKAIKARALVMPCTTDQYFEAEASEIEVSLMSPGIGMYKPIVSIYGHQAGANSNPTDTKFFNEAVAELFAEVEKKA
ncbi:alpha/beta hydrolase fold protein [Dacryopinax primogenitus]|uniref:Alpha/beta hydrolase fold protein n=1 Tax=Dacryopinax primogenitus (strain DJM 731) TaxID=1858805 RepID=M5G877_DACPD|nr:alpha/beta hydrolase fold protein [Dacryopinax primogenitus]EJU04969.1 alpha/beta hydrolase fold protein [Dacryopinax primogenitus]